MDWRWGGKKNPGPWVGKERFKPAPSSLELSVTLAVILSGFAGRGGSLGSGFRSCFGLCC